VSGQYHSLFWVAECSGCGNTTVGKYVWMCMFGLIKKGWEEY